jgi:hypothetical protein
MARRMSSGTVVRRAAPNLRTEELRSGDVQFLSIVADAADQFPRLVARDGMLPCKVADVKRLAVGGPPAIPRGAFPGLTREQPIESGLLRQPVVMPGLVPGIQVFVATSKEDVDGRDKPGHDEN